MTWEKKHGIVNFTTYHIEECSECGREKNAMNPDRVEYVIEYCPQCDEPPEPEDWGAKKHYCRGCWQKRHHCVCHHASYDPEVTVPMCSECHGRLHTDETFLPHLTPDMSRDEAEDRGLVTEIGLSE